MGGRPAGGSAPSRIWELRWKSPDLETREFWAAAEPKEKEGRALGPYFLFIFFFLISALLFPQVKGRSIRLSLFFCVFEISPEDFLACA